MKKIILILSLALISLNAYSQENNSKVSYKTNGLWDNWFANVGGGGSIYFGDTQHDEADLVERLTWGATVSVGKWISPIFGARLTFQGGQKHTFNENGAASNPGHKMATGNYVSAHADAMLNFSNLVAGYKENRFYNFIPYMGLGIATDNKEFKNKTAVAAVGFLNTFRISDKVAITLDISGQAVQSKFNDARFDTRIDIPQGQGRTTKGFNRQDWDGIGSAMLGITFGLGGKQKFERADASIIDNTDNSLISDLNSQINDLIAKNESLQQQLRDAQNKPEIPQTSIAKNVPNPVQFEINSSTIENKQEAVIYNVAEFLKNNPNTSVEIVGLADKKTGSVAYNKALSKRRAQAVETKLTKGYGIAKSRIISSWKGDTVQPYPTNDWNRVVIITVVDSE